MATTISIQTVTAGSPGMPGSPPVRRNETERAVTLTTVDAADAPARRINDLGIPELPVVATNVAGLTPPLQDRRIPHVFKEAVGAREGHLGEAISCMTCGYGEAGHPALTAPEQDVVTTLMNQKQAPPFVRRSILRKLTARLRIG